MQSLAPPVPAIEATEIMLELLNLKPTDRLLEIGTGTGTQTAIFQNHCAEVHSIELRQEYKVTDALGPHVYLSWGDGSRGDPAGAPYDAIVATCGVTEIPPAWIQQLNDGGRLVIPIGTNECQKLTRFHKRGQYLVPDRVGAYVRFVMMEKE